MHREGLLLVKWRTWEKGKFSANCSFQPYLCLPPTSVSSSLCTGSMLCLIYAHALALLGVPWPSLSIMAWVFALPGGHFCPSSLLVVLTNLVTGEQATLPD